MKRKKINSSTTKLENIKIENDSFLDSPRHSFQEEKSKTETISFCKFEDFLKYPHNGITLITFFLISFFVSGLAIIIIPILGRACCEDHMKCTSIPFMYWLFWAFLIMNVLYFFSYRTYSIFIKREDQDWSIKLRYHQGDYFISQTSRCKTTGFFSVLIFLALVFFCLAIFVVICLVGIFADSYRTAGMKICVGIFGF